MGTDLNDAALAGVGLQELADAADRQAPLLVTNVELDVAEGIEALKKFKVDVMKSQGAAEAGLLVSAALTDDVWMHRAAAAIKHKPNDVDALFTELETGGPREARPSIRKLRARINAESKNIRVATLSPKSMPLDYVTRDLGVRGLKVPEGYTITMDGVVKDDIQVFRLPVVVIRCAVTERGLMDEVAWYERGTWSTRLVPRLALADGRGMVTALANAGMPVITPTAALAVQFIDDFRSANAEALTPIQALNGFGWTRDGKSFLIGPDCIGPRAMSTASDKEKSYYTAAGSWEGWRGTVRKHVARHPRLLIGILACACAPLLKIMDAPGFTMAYVGETSTGKSTANMVASSAFGPPSHQSWNSTSMVGIYNKLAVAGSAPIVLDDTKKAKYPEFVEETLYSVPDGTDNTRGKSDGSGNQEPKTWHTLLLTSSESSLTTMGAKSGGSAARLIEIKGKTMESSEQIAPLLEELKDNHGWLVRRIAEWVLADDARPKRLKELRRKFVLELNENTPGGVIDRMNENVASLKVAAHVCREVGLDADFTAAFNVVNDSVVASSAAADRVGDCLDKIWARALACRDQFKGAPRPFGQPPNGGWLGEWVDGEDLRVVPTVFEKWIADCGYRPGDIMTALEMRGLVVKDGTRHPRSTMSGARLVTLKKETKL